MKTFESEEPMTGGQSWDSIDFNVSHRSWTAQPCIQCDQIRRKLIFEVTSTKICDLYRHILKAAVEDV